MSKKIVILIIAFIAALFFMPEIAAFVAKTALSDKYVKASWAPRVVYTSGKLNMRFFRYESARQILEKSVVTFPNEEWVDEAHYQIAFCYEKENKVGKAIKQYELFARLYPNHDWVGQAKKRIVNIRANQ